MNDEERAYEAWRRVRATAPVPEGFAARVTARVAEAGDRRGGSPLLALAAALAMSRLGRAALLGIALVVFVLRAAGSLSVFAAS